jgi:hypothetical protein
MIRLFSFRTVLSIMLNAHQFSVLTYLCTVKHTKPRGAVGKATVKIANSIINPEKKGLGRYAFSRCCFVIFNKF